MFSQVTEGIAKMYSERHNVRQNIFGDKPYSNFGYWTREGMSVEEACDALTDLVAKAAGIGPGDRVLEVGCGYGASAVYYTSRYGPTSVVGIDPTEVRVREAGQYIAENGLADTIRVHVGDATSLQYEDGTFTNVLAIECAFHFNTRCDFFREAGRVLTQGGVLALTDAIPRQGVSREEYLSRIHFLAGPDGRIVVPENVYGADTYRDHLRAAGFDDVHLEVITDRTIPHFADHLEQLSRRSDGQRAERLLNGARIYRDYIAAGMEYVLVSARKSGA